MTGPASLLTLLVTLAACGPAGGEAVPRPGGDGPAAPADGPGGAMIDPSTLPDPAASPEAALDAALRAAADRVLRGGMADPLEAVLSEVRRDAGGAITALGLTDAALRARAERALRQQING